jgi:hypothetical protein
MQFNPNTSGGRFLGSHFLTFLGQLHTPHYRLGGSQDIINLCNGIHVSGRSGSMRPNVQLRVAPLLATSCRCSVSADIKTGLGAKRSLCSLRFAPGVLLSTLPRCGIRYWTRSGSWSRDGPRAPDKGERIMRGVSGGRAPLPNHAIASTLSELTYKLARSSWSNEFSEFEAVRPCLPTKSSSVCQPNCQATDS